MLMKVKPNVKQGLPVCTSLASTVSMYTGQPALISCHVNEASIQSWLITSAISHSLTCSCRVFLLFSKWIIYHSRGCYFTCKYHCQLKLFFFSSAKLSKWKGRAYLRHIIIPESAFKDAGPIMVGVYPAATPPCLQQLLFMELKFGIIHKLCVTVWPTNTFT